ncbi:MAG: hypothetical protein AB8B64_02730 [Granulosicoccus sp.]
MVCDTLVVRGTGFLFLWVCLLSLLAGGGPSALLAQQRESTDFEAPIIEYTSPDAGTLGGVEVFGATVVDNEEIRAVSLFYRFSGETQFAELPMREIASSSYYTVKVDTASVPLDTEAIEYYLQAEDVSGNIVLKGFAFQPLVRPFTVTEPEASSSVISATAPEVQSQIPALDARSGKINWVYVAVGVLVTGGVVVALDNDDGGGGAAIGEDECCTVNLTFGRL